MVSNRRNYDASENYLYGRDTDDFVDHLTREELDDILGRELVDDIEVRSPLVRTPALRRLGGNGVGNAMLVTSFVSYFKDAPLKMIVTLVTATWLMLPP